MRRPIDDSSPGQAVYGPFVGSGTTIIAAEMTGRVCHAIEIDPAYVDVTVKRWQDFTGETGKLETSGQSFDEVVSRAGSDARPFHAEAGGAVKGQAQSRTRRRHPR